MSSDIRIKANENLEQETGEVGYGDYIDYDDDYYEEIPRNQVIYFENDSEREEIIHEREDQRVTRNQLNQHITDHIKMFLKKIDDTHGKNNKILVVTELMDYLVQNKDYVRRHAKFELTVRNKFIEFATKDQIFYPHHYWILFHEKLPGYSENDYKFDEDSDFD